MLYGAVIWEHRIHNVKWCVDYWQPGQPAHFSQLYIYDTDHEADNRMGIMGKGLKHAIVVSLQAMLHQNNDFVQLFERAAAQGAKLPNLQIVISAEPHGKTADVFVS